MKYTLANPLNLFVAVVLSIGFCASAFAQRPETDQLLSGQAPSDFSGSKKGETTDGPHLGNGIRNSWATQNSIALWTRTTRHAEMNAKGARFLQPSKKQLRELEKLTDAAKLNAAQLPDGITRLDQMFGAAPGQTGEVRLSYRPIDADENWKLTAWSKTEVHSDYTHQWHLKNLSPGTTYEAVVHCRPIGANKATAERRCRFQTAPRPDAAAEVSFCVTTCHDFYRRDDGMRGHKIYPAMTDLKPNFVVHAGDIEYYDKPDPWAMTRELMRFKWARLFSLPNNREFYSTHTTYFIKDDHDTLKNDSWPGTRYGSVTFDQGLQIFNREQFPSHPKRYQTVRWGKDTQIWILEGRDYRSPNTMPDGPEKTILGEEQKSWLFQTLNQSDAAFKLVFSPTPIVGPDRANKRDNHANDIFAYEGSEIRDRLADIPGVIVMCGDRHWQYASVDAENGIWEFGCGPGSQKHQFGWKAGDKRPVHRFLRVAGGFLSGHVSTDKATGKPKLVLRHRNVDGEQKSKFVFPEAWNKSSK